MVPEGKSPNFKDFFLKKMRHLEKQLQPRFGYLKRYIPYVPIPSASSFGVGFGYLNTFSQGIWSTRVCTHLYICIYIWVFPKVPKIWENPPKSSHLFIGFSRTIINFIHFGGFRTLIFGSTPIYIYIPQSDLLIPQMEVT